MIEVQNLTRYYSQPGGQSRVPVVDNISFRLPKGKTLVLLGTSGSGKTTTLKMLNRLVEPSGGSVIIGGRNVLLEEPHTLRRKIGYVIQNIGLLPHMTVGQNISIVPRLLGWNEKTITDRVEFLLDLLNLQDVGPSRLPSELSGGQQQRVGLARALAGDPDIVLMDEPFGALDPITRIAIRKEFLALEEILRKTLVIVTHDVPEAWEMGDLICIMDKGKIVQQGSPYELVWHPQNEFVREFLKPHRSQLEMMTITLGQIDKELPDSMDPQMNLRELFTDLEQKEDIEGLIYYQKKYLGYKQTGNKRIT